MDLDAWAMVIVLLVPVSAKNDAMIDVPKIDGIYAGHLSAFLDGALGDVPSFTLVFAV